MPKLKKPQILLHSVIKGLIEQKSHFYPHCRECIADDLLVSAQSGEMEMQLHWQRW